MAAKIETTTANRKFHEKKIREISSQISRKKLSRLRERLILGEKIFTPEEKCGDKPKFFYALSVPSMSKYNINFDFPVIKGL